MCTADSIITVQPNPASTNHHHPGIMQKPGIPAQQMQRTGTREQASEDWLQGAGRTVRRFAAPAGRACPDPSARCAGRRRSSATATVELE